MKRKHNLGILFIDYLQLIRGVSKSENRVSEISEITQGLKAIAKELNIPVIALSQLSRAGELREDKKPMLSDLRESGTIEQDADIVMFIYREEYYLTRKEPAAGDAKHAEWLDKLNKVYNIADIIVAKHRNGPVGNVPLYYDSQFSKFVKSRELETKQEELETLKQNLDNPGIATNLLNSAETIAQNRQNELEKINKLQHE
ncbi:hypothetical protein IscW_ISCW016743, partial [Ixodes scapularis]